MCSARRPRRRATAPSASPAIPARGCISRARSWRCAERDGALRVETPKGAFDLDFLIFGTGFGVDATLRPELRLVAPQIRRWGDRFTPGPDQAQAELAASPDLAPDLSFQERTPGACPALARIHCFTYPATLSHGKLTGDIPAVSVGARRLALAITRDFFVADREAHFATLEAFATPELQGDEWPAERIV